MEILKVNKDDLPEILTLQKSAYQENAIRYNNPNIPPLQQTLDDLNAEFEYKIFLKAVINDIIIGSVRACKKDDQTFIEKLIVHPDYQNQGIGSKLMLAIENEYKSNVFRLFTGHLDDKNISLYSKLGYVIYGELEYISPELSFIHMEKLLPKPRK